MAANRTTSPARALTTWTALRHDRVNRTRLRLAASLALVLAIGVFTVVPLIYLALQSLGLNLLGAEPGFRAYVRAFSSSATLPTIANTIVLVVLRLVPAVILGLLTAYLLVQTDLAFKRTIQFLLWLGFFLPVFPIALGWILLMDPSYGLLNRVLPIFNIYSYGGIAWVHLTTTTLPVFVLLLVPALRLLNAELEEAALVCGSHRFDALRRVVVPVLTPTLLTIVILVIMRGLEAFEIELLLGIPAGIRVFSTQIYEYVSLDTALVPEASALGTVFIVVLLLLASFYQRHALVGHYTTVTGRATQRPLTRLGRWRPWLSGAVLGYCLLAIVPPLLLLLIGSFLPIYGFFDLDPPFTLSHWRTVLTDTAFLPSLRNTLVIGFAASILGILLYGLLAYLLVRSKLRFKGLLSLLVWLPWGIPGLLLGMSLVRTFLGVPGLNLLYGTIGALVVARLIATMPLGVQMLRSSLLQLHHELEEASAVSGAALGTTFRRILLPLLSQMALTVGVISFVGTVKDISTMVLLSNRGTRPLSILMLDFSVGGELEKGAVVGIISTVLVVVVAVVAARLGLMSGSLFGEPRTIADK